MFTLIASEGFPSITEYQITLEFTEKNDLDVALNALKKNQLNAIDRYKKSFEQVLDQFQTPFNKE